MVSSGISEGICRNSYGILWFPMEIQRDPTGTHREFDGLLWTSHGFSHYLPPFSPFKSWQLLWGEMLSRECWGCKVWWKQPCRAWTDELCEGWLPTVDPEQVREEMNNWLWPVIVSHRLIKGLVVTNEMKAQCTLPAAWLHTAWAKAGCIAICPKFSRGSIATQSAAATGPSVVVSSISAPSGLQRSPRDG